MQKRKVYMMGGVVEMPPDQAELVVQRGLARYVETMVERAPEKTASPRQETATRKPAAKTRVEKRG